MNDLQRWWIQLTEEIEKTKEYKIESVKFEIKMFIWKIINKIK